VNFFFPLFFSLYIIFATFSHIFALCYNLTFIMRIVQGYSKHEIVSTDMNVAILSILFLKCVDGVRELFVGGCASNGKKTFRKYIGIKHEIHQVVSIMAVMCITL